METKWGFERIILQKDRKGGLFMHTYTRKYLSAVVLIFLICIILSAGDEFVLDANAKAEVVRRSAS